jgi:hypothetical protein
MKLTRREFFKRTAAAGAAVALAPLMPLCPAPKPLAVSMRFVRSFDVTTRLPARMDVLYGVAAIRPNYDVRVLNA